MREGQGRLRRFLTKVKLAVGVGRSEMVTVMGQGIGRSHEWKEALKRQSKPHMTHPVSRDAACKGHGAVLTLRKEATDTGPF